MRVLMISYNSLLQRAYRRKCDEICRQGRVELTVLTPHHWKERWASGRLVPYEPGDGREPYRSVLAPILLAGNGHLAFFRGGLGHLMATFRPDLIDLEREPWSWASAQVLWLRKRRCPSARLVFHASQNALKWYPPPFRQIEKAVYREADCALPRSEAAARVLRARGFRGRLHVIPHGVDTDLFKPAEDRVRGGGPVVGFVGALTEQKGVETLLAAVARLDPGVRCLIVGDGPRRGGLEAMSRRLGIANRVVFERTVPHRRVAEDLRRMSVFVLPAVSLPGLAERFGRVLIEAMATGLPVVGSDSGEIPNVIGDAGVVVPQREPEALARAISKILSDSKAVEALGRRARRRAESMYSWRQVARRTLEVYEEVMGPAGALR